MAPRARMSFWDPAYHPKNEHTSSKEYIEKNFNGHYWLRGRTKDDAFKLLDELSKSPKVHNIYFYTVGIRPGKPIPVSEFVMEVEINVKDESKMLFWRQYYSDNDPIKHSKLYKEIDRYWRTWA